MADGSCNLVVLGPKTGDRVEVEWPCEGAEHDGCHEVRSIWFLATVAAVRDGRKPRYLLRFDDGQETWNSLSELSWRRVESVSRSIGSLAYMNSTVNSNETHDGTGFVHMFSLEQELLHFCDELHERREVFGDKTRGDAAYGEPLHGGLVSVVVRRDALPPREREFYHNLHQRCIEQVPQAWPAWLRRAAGKEARARPSQDLRLLQYSEGANFKSHVDSGWACQALIYLNEDFQGGCTEFPNLGARYRPQRGRVLMWRSLCVGHKPADPGSLDDHPALHVAGQVFGGTKRVVSLHLVLA